MPILAENKLASFSYDIQERYTAGLKMTGPEVKAAKLGHCSLRGAFVTLKRSTAGTEAWVRGLHISPYGPAKGSQRGYDPTRDRKLLLNRHEINRLVGFITAVGLTVIPIRVYTKNSLIKLEIAVAKQRSKADKREVIKKRESSRQIRQALGR